eukprot:GHVU01131859.1.p1 GENE.GHVU01131859.1~~GHVU01131859.1.p1  ORF type:complete len:231 (-),score=53.55 GHVU01131859.1:1615-2307(-)
MTTGFMSAKERMDHVNSLEAPEALLEEDRKVLNLYSEGELMKTIAEYVPQCTDHIGYPQENVVGDLRLLMLGVACAIAAYASIMLKFPQDATMLKWCVVAFFAVITASMIYERAVAKNALLILKAPYGTGERLFYDLSFDRHSAQVTMGVSDRRGDLLLHHRTVGDYFEADGTIMSENIFEDVRKLLIDFEKGKRTEQQQPPKQKGSPWQQQGGGKSKPRSPASKDKKRK